ncbi:PTS system unknown substrate IIC component (Fru family) [Hydrogenispora ethanolica]|uniref:PTS EIIC type-2 domain-containing protein n=1 Tax=Hydrogenispora ethanolica TaxID=1082276 RepID=A0A4R1SB34_HYDET|nr:PTS fructose transporter subunit IIC [Hydrogenispora ethanolica]TCL76454.1 PTS system unknown substrate IIC component (Fru family) [Hydrogenispora ethanolica]
MKKGGFQIKKHLLTGVSYMLPVVVVGGLCMALAKILGGPLVGDQVDTIPWMINSIGAAAMTFVVPVLAAGVAYSIADRPGIAPGLFMGLIATNIKAGFLGGVLGALLVGYLLLWLKDHLKMPKSMQGLKSIMVLPLLSSLIIGLLMMGLLGKPIAIFQEAILSWMKAMQGGSRFVLGAIIGAMMGFDLGGPVNKTASLFTNALLAEKVYGPEAIKIIGGMVPPLGVALSVLLTRKKYTRAEVESAKAAFPLGLCFITEGVLPFAASDPLRVIPACTIGAAVAGGLALMWGAGSPLPHGGVFAIPFMEHPVQFIIALIIGSVVTAALLSLFKPEKPADADETLSEEEESLDDLEIKLDL